MNTTLTAFLNDLISSSIACSPKGSLHIKSSYDLTGASPKTRRAVQLGYHSTQTKSAGILDNVMNELSHSKLQSLIDNVSNNKTVQSVINEVSTNKALQAGLAGAVIGGGLTAMTGKSYPEETATHRALRILGNATLAGGLVGGAAYSLPKAVEEVTQALPANDINPVARITGSSPVRGATTTAGFALGSLWNRKKPSILTGYNDRQLDAAKQVWKNLDIVNERNPLHMLGHPGFEGDTIPLKLRQDLESLAKAKGTIPRDVLHNLVNTNSFTPETLNTPLGGTPGAGTFAAQLEHAGINTDTTKGFKGLKNTTKFKLKNLGRNISAGSGVAGLARLGLSTALGYYAPDIAKNLISNTYDTITKH